MKNGWILTGILLLAVEAAGGGLLAHQYLQRETVTEHHLSVSAAEDVFLQTEGAASAAGNTGGVTEEPSSVTGETDSTETNRVTDPVEPEVPESEQQITVSIDTENFSYGGQMVGIASCSSSSNYTDERTAYEAVDGDLTTSWQEGVSGTGIGEWMQIDFDQEYPVQYMTFHMGNWNTAKGDDYYYQNNYRPHGVKITLYGSEKTWDMEIYFPDDHQQHLLVLSSPISLYGMKLEILSVHTANATMDETCIAEVGIYY